MASYYNGSVTPNVTMTVVQATGPCTYSGTKCVGTVEYVCTNGVEVADGNTCGVVPVPNNDLIILGALAGVALIGLAVVLGGKKGRG